MNDVLAGLESLTRVITDAQSVVAALQALRDKCSEEEWEALNACTPLETLLDACSDLEHSISQ